MEEKESNQWRLKHIIEAIEYIEEFTKGVDKQILINDYQLQSALVRQVEIIGDLRTQFRADKTRYGRTRLEQ